jgi:hypothetical protein
MTVVHAVVVVVLSHDDVSIVDEEDNSIDDGIETKATKIKQDGKRRTRERAK